MMLDIGSQLDTIAKLLAGAPPGPEEKFLFQKYVYCKEDYTSWVVSLLGDLGIAYTQVDSLVNGLYEYRCEATNDQFNQLILKVELSTNPVLATYKKIDSFSDLIGINVFDMDSYAAGCDSRISKSDTITADAIKYWLNVQNDQVVQRQIDLAGSASIGTYSIDFTGGNVISGSVPVNGSIRDNILYRKKISGSAFDYSLTNCTIEGWMIDLLLNPNDISNNYTVVTGGVNAPLAYDDNMGTSAYYSKPGSGYGTVWEVSFSSRHISEIHLGISLKANSTSNYAYYKLDACIDGVWNYVFGHYNKSTTTYIFYPHHNTEFNESLVTGLRVQIRQLAGYTAYVKIYDISAQT